MTNDDVLSNRASRSVSIAIALGAVVVAAGCGDLNTPIYVESPDTLEINQAMDAPTTATGPLVLRFRRPSQTEQQKLNADSDSLGFDVPWLQRDNIHIELLYTVTNQGDTPGTFTIGVDGANEYTKYDETVVAMAFVAANEDPVQVPLIQPTPQNLGAHQVFQGTVREDDFKEGSLDLDAMGRWMAPFAAVLTNRSEVNPIGLEMVPKDVVIPAMQEIDLTLGSPTGSHMTCQFMARVRDDNDQLLHESSDRLFVPMPTVFMPVIMANN
jgi:hypothetical protein